LIFLLVNDNNVLQYALTLENLEAAFYTQGLGMFAESNFTAAGFSSTTHDFLVIINQHERAHVAALRGLLMARGVVPVDACSYNFPYNSVATFLGVARILEETGVKAYDGAIQSLV
jgi:hypothetical protein